MCSCSYEFKVRISLDLFISAVHETVTVLCSCWLLQQLSQTIRDFFSFTSLAFPYVLCVVIIAKTCSNPNSDII